MTAVKGADVTVSGEVIVTGETHPLWLRWEGESLRAYDALQGYIRLSTRERSLARTGRDLGISTATLEEWSVRWSWVTRVQAWEDHQAQIRFEAHQKATVEMSERHALAAQQGIRGLSVAAIALLRRLAQPGPDGKPLPPESHFSGMPISDLIDLVAVGARGIKSLVEVERLARGMSTDNVEIQAPVSGGVNDDLVTLIRTNPQAARHASALLVLLTDGGSGSAGLSEGDADVRAQDDGGS